MMTRPVEITPDLRLTVAPDARALTVSEAMALGLELIQTATVHSLLASSSKPRKRPTPGSKAAAAPHTGGPMLNPLKHLFALRPANDTVDAISDALERTRLMAEAVNVSINVATLRRDGLLLDGTEADLTAAENAIREDREDLERLGAMRVQLEARLRSATYAADTSKAKEAAEAVDAAHDAILGFIQTRLPQLSKLAAEGKALLDAHRSAMDDHIQVNSGMVRKYSSRGSGASPSFQVKQFDPLDSRLDGVFATIRNAAAMKLKD